MFNNEIREFLKPQGKGLAVGAGCGSTPQDLESESVCRVVCACSISRADAPSTVHAMEF